MNDVTFRKLEVERLTEIRTKVAADIEKMKRGDFRLIRSDARGQTTDITPEAIARDEEYIRTLDRLIEASQP